MEIKKIEKEFTFEAPASKDWCGCCDRPRAEVKIVITVIDGELEIDAHDKWGDDIYLRETHRPIEE